MPENTDNLIERLTRDAAPVKALRAPMVRAGAFLGVVVAVMSVLVAFAGDRAGLLSHLSDLPYAVTLAGAFVAGVSALVSAVMLSIPGRSEAWIYLPVPGALLWLAAGLVECARNAAKGATEADAFAGDCFIFILGAGAPVIAATYFLFRGTVPVHASSVAALAGLGAAWLAAFLLQLMHAHGASPIDFGSHILAVATLMLFAMTIGRPTLKT